MSRKVLCVKDELLGQRYGLVTGYDAAEMRMSYPPDEWVEKEAAETDPTYRQIIPYCIAQCGSTKRIVLMQRGEGTEESRLHGLYTIGVGGHVEEHDKLIETALRREFKEELADSYTARIILSREGIIRMDDSPVSRVHIGLLYHALTKEEFQFTGPEAVHHNPRWVTLAELHALYHQCEPWTQLLIDEYLPPA